VFPLRDNIPTEHFPVVTVALIIANCFVYFFLQNGLWEAPSSGAEWPWQQYAAIPCEFTGRGECATMPGGPSTILTAFTSMFMHGSLLHLGGNMLFLWIFGNNVEDSMGPVKFIVFYLLAGLAANAGQILVNTSSEVPSLGASGAVAGVLGGYLLLFPGARVVTLIFIIFFFTILELPAILFLGLWIVQQAVLAYFDLLQPSEGGGVAYFAHIGGFVCGLLLIRVFASEKRRKRQLQRAGMR
jgi:membrane associated rhomboid family serine protease